MVYSGDSARIKVWQDAIPGAGGVVPTNAGGGYGWVKNVTYDTVHDTSDDCKSPEFLWWGDSNFGRCY